MFYLLLFVRYVPAFNLSDCSRRSSPLICPARGIVDSPLCVRNECCICVFFSFAKPRPFPSLCWGNTPLVFVRTSFWGFRSLFSDLPPSSCSDCFCPHARSMNPFETYALRSAVRTCHFSGISPLLFRNGSAFFQAIRPLVG